MQNSSSSPSKSRAPTHLIICTAFTSFLTITSLFLSYSIFSGIKLSHVSTSFHEPSSTTSLDHIVFGIYSDSKSWPSRRNYARIWWKPKQMKGCVFLESKPPDQNNLDREDGNNNKSSSLPPICVSQDTSRFRYTYRNGPRSEIRRARVVLETFALGYSDARWFVFGDDDTVFFPDNLVKVLSKYDHRLWYYIGTNSESYAANKMFSHGMAFGGAGFAISYPLARVLAKVLDSCLHRYPHLYGSDGRIYACVSELGVGLTREPGFHQMDIRGNMFGFLASHPLSPIASLHHLDAVDPIFPNTTSLKSIERLFRAVSFDPHRVMQQSVCYDRWFSWTISISWGYAVQIFPRNVFLPDALRTQESYLPWKKGGGVSDLYEVDTSEYHLDPCRRAPVFFLHDVSLKGKGMVRSSYRKMGLDNCTLDMASPRKLEEIRVFSQKKELDEKQIKAARRQCCDVLPSSADTVMEIAIRECGEEELSYMH